MINAMRTPGDRRWYRLSHAALILAAWATLAAWGASPFAGLLHAAVSSLPALQAASGGIAAAILLLAGAYQFTPLKMMCLEKCRSPYSFLVSHWSGKHAGRDAFRLGIRHGLFCLGCCW